MPGPVSDSYDVEWGTRANAEKIGDALDAVYARISRAIGDPKPLFILDLINAKCDGAEKEIGLTVKQLRIIRFALERAKESL